MQAISSLQNAKVKNLVRLQEKSREREAEGLFVVEGRREILRALSCHWEAQRLFWLDKEDLDQEGLHSFQKLAPAAEIIGVNEAVFRKIAYRENSDGMVAILKMRSLELDSLSLPANPLLLILESVEKPGNLGAILRTADGAGVDAVIVCDPRTDVYNPNCVRASLGCLFSVPVAVASNAATQNFLREKGIRSFAALPASDHMYYQEDFTGAVAFVLGTEADGLSEDWIRFADCGIKIPMLGIADSLNVSVSAALLAYEARRQRMSR